MSENTRALLYGISISLIHHSGIARLFEKSLLAIIRIGTLRVS